MEKLMKQIIEAIGELGTLPFLEWAPVLLSVVAVVVAIYIPSRIAKKQNQIAVFDKLYTAYSHLLLVKSFAGSIREYSFAEEENDACASRELFCVHFEMAFGYRPDLSDYDTCATSIGTAIAVLRKNERQAYMLPMLISKREKQKQEYSDKISAIYEPLFLITTYAILFNPDEAHSADDALKEFVRATDTFFSECADTIEKALMCRVK